MLDKELFKIGNFSVTGLVMLLSVLLLILLVAAIAFRQNYIIQVRLSRLMDAESIKHNYEGFTTLLNKRKKKIKKASRQVSPAIVIFSLENLASLYIGYKNNRYLMRTISDIFTEGLYKPEFVSRIDFSKFGVVLADRNREEVKEYILKCIERLNETDFEAYGYYTFDVTCAVYEAVPFQNIKREVDLAIHTLKYATIKDEHIYYYSEDVLRTVLRLEEMNEIKETELENGHIVGYIQPKIDFTNGKIVGGEILARWINEDKTTRFNVDEFIPLFESNGFIRQIDLKMFETACEVVSYAQRKNVDIIVSVNFARLTVNSLRNVDKLLEITSKHSINPDRIEIELSETQFGSYNRSFETALLRIRQAGFRISLDNFGKEKTSLSLLSENRFENVKLDKFFFENSLANEKEKNMAKNTISLLSSLGCKIVLVGVETLTCLDYLSTVKRDLSIQGNYFSYPVPISKFDPEMTFKLNYADDSDKQTVEVNTVEMTKIVEPIYANTTQLVPNELLNSKIREVDELRMHLFAEHQRLLAEVESQKQQLLEERRKAEMEALKQQFEQTRMIDKYDRDIEDLRRQLSDKDRQIDDKQREIMERDREIENLRRQLDDARDRPNIYEKDHRVDQLLFEFQNLKNQQNNNQGGSAKDFEMALLRHQLEDLKDQSQARDHQLEMDALKRQMEDIKNSQNQPQIAQPQRDPEMDIQMYEMRRQLEEIRQNQKETSQTNKEESKPSVDVEALIKELSNKHKDELDSAISKIQSDNQSTIEELKSQNEALKANSESQLDSLKLQNESLLNDLQNKHTEALNEIKSQNDVIMQQNSDIKSQNEELQEKLEAERREREELEAMLRDLQMGSSSEDEISDEEAEAIQEEANNALSLNEDDLVEESNHNSIVEDHIEDESDDDSEEEHEDESEDDEEESKAKEEHVEKSELSLEEIEALIKNYQDRFQDDWMIHAKAELQGGFDELVKGLKFYKLKNQERRTFVDKVKKLTPELKQIYNIIKNEFMKYKGVTNRLTNSCDVIYKGRGQVGKINFTASKIKLYLAVDPNNEEYSKIPHKDLSGKKTHARTPFYMLLKSPLSIKRAKKLIADMMENLECEENPSYKPIDYATKYKFFKKDQKK